MNIYMEHILDLYKNPHNYGELQPCTHSHREINTLCGDDITMNLIVENDQVKDICFTGKGCALSMASASLITDEIKGKKIDEVMHLSKKDVLDLIEIEVGIVRLKCVLLPLETVHKAIQGEKIC